jgi:hypothetical protein
LFASYCHVYSLGLKTLDLSRNPLGPLSAPSLCIILQESNTIKTLDVSYCELDNEVCERMILAASGAIVMTTLRVDGNDISALNKAKVEVSFFFIIVLLSFLISSLCYMLQGEVQANVLLDAIQRDPQSVNAGVLSKVVCACMCMHIYVCVLWPS